MEKNERRRLHRVSGEKRLRYSVRKFNVGVVSVAVAAFMFLGGNTVAADTVVKTDSSIASTENIRTVPDSEGKSDSGTSKSTADSGAPSSQVADKTAKSEATSQVSETPSSQVADKTAKSEATSQVSEAPSSQVADKTAKSEATSQVSEASSTLASTGSTPESGAQSTAVESGNLSIKDVTSKATNLATTNQTSAAIAQSEVNSTLAAAQNEVNKGYADFRRVGESGFRRAGVSGFRSAAGVSGSSSFDSKTGETTVTKENFLDYFRLNGSATYNKDDGTVTLTPDEPSKGGNFSLKSKINMNQSFKLTGEVNIGDKTQAKGGADGIGFAFHTGDTTDLGASGGNLGIGGLRNATGFKLDTYRNVYAPPRGDRFDTNGKGFFEYGWSEDPKLDQYGAWVNTTLKKIPGNFQGKSVEYERWWAETDFNSAQSLDSSDLDNKFHKFTIDYNGTTKELTITYESNSGTKEWKKVVSTPEDVMSMVVTASTGGFKNLQQFKIKSFNFYQGASVDVRYEDEQGRVIAEGSVTYPQGAFKGKTYTTEQKNIPNYDFVGMKNGSLPPSGSLADWGSNGTVTYVYRQGKEPVTDPAKLNSKVTRTIKYEYADGQTAGRPALKAPVTQEATFTRTGERNRVTGEETFTPWTPATKELAQEDTPVVTGFVADKANVAAKTVTPDDKDSEEVVQYKELGSYVPNVPDGLPKVPKLPYPNDPTDPTKPGTDLPLIPHVPGTTPVGPDGTTPLTPKDPNDPSKGYNPPPIPNDPTQDTPINYVKDGQKAIITFVDQDDNNKELGKVVENGKSGDPIGTSNYETRLKELTDKGYEVVNDEFAGPKNFDNDDKKDQQFVVTLRQGKEPVTDPAKLNSKVTRTIKYEYADGQTAGRPALKAPVTQEAAFTRTGERNRVTGVETFGAWTPATQELAQEATPVVTGFVADKANVAAKIVTPDDKDSEEIVKYNKLGSYVPNVPDGLPKVPNLPYPNDPTDPTKPGTDLPLIPHVPGTTPVGPDGTTPLTPKDPNDPSKGYNPPPVPSDPTKDTPINYVKDGQKAIISFVDQTDGNKELAKVVESGKSGEPIGTTNYEARLKELTDKGYEVVTDEFAGPKNFDNDNKTDQTFIVTLRQGTEKITDPAKLNSKVTRTIKYEYADGETAGRPALKAPVTQEAAFTRTGERNRVTGVETFGAWTPATQELAQEATPVVTGFVADKANVAAKIVTPDDKDSEEIVKYNKLGSYVPNVPDGLPKVPNLPYPNDPTDPTKPGTDLPLIPHVPGTTPVGPDGTTPLTPKDPSDPSKGYNPPPVPSDPTKDTPINYIPVPVTPKTPEQPAEPATPQYMDGQRELPNTGTEANSSLAALGLLGALSGFGLIARKKRKDEE
ncbi:YSIRK signal domain/LPXTG anchor domain surface protein [Ligilactobacillus salivarius]|uniref:YSIRK signal domain/LPXTG anchor domain surface protein n=5 Tax=Ligilactobacillus salivarius TaxID=1624 RepID=UPI0006806E45|nr:YSIRK signal domain/LPXTG anchor domain surface protein [Ligilactobacillus salivarius]